MSALWPRLLARRAPVTQAQQFNGKPDQLAGIRSDSYPADGPLARVAAAYEVLTSHTRDNKTADQYNICVKYPSEILAVPKLLGVALIV